MTADPIPPLARSAIDRAAHRRTDPGWLSAAWPRARVLIVDPSGHALAAPEEGSPTQPGTPVGRPSSGKGGLVLVGAGEAPAGERLFLGVDGEGTPYFAVVGELPRLPGTRAVTIREVGADLSARDAGLLVTAVALANWHATHPYAPAKGTSTTVTEGGWLRVDPEGTQMFPRTDPAVIVLVHDGVAGPAGRCLLGSNAAWQNRPGGRFFSALAGFVEPGESAEAAVVREVYEEVGVRVSGLRYQGSQSWPYPASLMLGFTGLADPAAPLQLDPAEIAEARWFTRAEVSELLSDRPDPSGAPHGAVPPGATVALPGPASIASFLIRTWAEEPQLGGLPAAVQPDISV